ncbi:MAG: DUF5399 family protein [Chlamydiota bacterium]
MSKDVKTIDNLGDDVSLQYIANQEELKTTSKALRGASLKETSVVADLAGVVSQSPYEASWQGFQKHYSPHLTQDHWAHILPPPHFFTAMRRLFTHTLIPSMGTQDTLRNLAEKCALVGKADERGSGKDSKGDERKKKSASKADNSKHAPPPEQEKASIQGLLQLLQRLNDDLHLVNTLRNQYHKG